MLSTFLATCAGIVFGSTPSAGYPLAAVGVELMLSLLWLSVALCYPAVSALCLPVIWRVLIQGLIQTYITFDGTLSLGGPKSLSAFCCSALSLWQRLLIIMSERRKVVNTS